MGTVNALAVRFLKAFERPAQYEVANRFWVDEIVMFSMYGMDRKGQTEPLTDHRANSGYTGPRQDYYARALINRFIIGTLASASSHRMVSNDTLLADAVIAASSGDHRAQCLVDSVFSKVLDASFHSSDIEGHELYRNGYPYRKLMRCWQTMCLLAEGISHSCFEASASSIWRTYEQQSETSVRSMVSVFLAIAFRRFPSSADPHLVEVRIFVSLLFQHLLISAV